MPPRKSTSSYQPFQHEFPSNSRIRRALNIPALRAIVILSAIFLACLLYGKLNFYRDPGSVFYDESRAFERRYSAVREAQAKTYIKNVSTKYPDHFSEPGPLSLAHNATICASFLTTVRPGVEPYLDAAIASALDRLTPVERQQMYLTVFFATTNPHDHSTYHKPWLRKVVDEVFTYDDWLPPADIDLVRELEYMNDGLRKAPYDYTIPLRHCYENSKAKYIAIFEDDIILAEGWLARTLLSLQRMEATMKAEKRRGEWLYMRLFTQESSTGWKSKKMGGNQEFKHALFIGAGIGLLLLIVRRRSRRLRFYFDNWTLAIVCLIFTPLFTILFFQSGKASLRPPQPGLREESSGCCSQGLVLNRHHAEPLSEFMLQRRQDGYHDVLLEDYARVFELARWSQYPMMIQHVGTHSSVQKQTRHWSMAFENLNPKKLAHEHGEMVERLFGAEAYVHTDTDTREI